jgi:2-C-methyl-D-erythritol 4-phosphate cytidylyltransferase
MKISAVVLAGGEGSRFGAHVPKAFMSLNGKPVVQYAIDGLTPFVDEIVVVAKEPYRDYPHALPGKTRGQSVRNGVELASHGKVVVHDAVRPFLTERIVVEIVAALEHSESVDTAVPIIDGYLQDGIPMPKAGRWIGQTPEAFDKAVLLKAFSLATREYDDEVGMVYDVLGIAPHIVEGVYLNTKITFEKDLENAEGVMRYWQEPVHDTPDLSRPTLVLGGTGGIGASVHRALPNSDAPTRQQLDLSTPFEIDLAPYQSIVHAAGEYADENRIMDVNFFSVLRLVDQAVQQRWRGCVVVLSSTAGAYGRKGIALYSASKAALNAWIEATHEELAERGIYLNAIAPAKVNTRLQRAINPDANPEEMMTPEFVSRRVLAYLDTTAHGHIIYLRYGLDER